MSSLRDIWQEIDASRARDPRFAVAAIAPPEGKLDVWHLVLHWIECQEQRTLYRVTTIHSLNRKASHD